MEPDKDSREPGRNNLHMGQKYKGSIPHPEKLRVFGISGVSDLQKEHMVSLLQKSTDSNIEIFFSSLTSEIEAASGIMTLVPENEKVLCDIIAAGERDFRDLITQLPYGVFLDIRFNIPEYGGILGDFLENAFPETNRCEGRRSAYNAGSATVISTKKHDLIHEYRSLLSLSGRIKNSAYTAENELMVTKSLNSGLPVDSVLYIQGTAEKFAEIGRLCHEKGIPFMAVSPGIMSAASETHPLPEVVCRIKHTVRRASDLPLPCHAGSLLLLDKISSPDNLGMILRTADAARLDAVILLSDSVHYVGKNVIRGARGAIGRVPVYLSESKVEDSAIFERLIKAGYRIIGTSAKAKDDSFFGMKMNDRNAAFIVGNESDGMRQENIDRCTDFIKIPMSPGQSSLNIAVAASLLMYKRLGDLEW